MQHLCRKAPRHLGLLPYLETLLLSGLGLVIFEVCPWLSVLWDLKNACELYTERCHYVTQHGRSSSVYKCNLCCPVVALPKLFCVNSGCYLISECSPMSCGFVQLRLDNTVRDTKPQFDCDLFSCFYRKDSGEGGVSHCEDFFVSLLSSYL